MIAMVTRRTAATGLETWMELISKEHLWQAMKDSKIKAAAGVGQDCSSIPKLSQAAGVSQALVGFLVAPETTKHSRSTCTVEKAEQLAAALGLPVTLLFFKREQTKVAA